MYYNTTHLTGFHLDNEKLKTLKQDEIITIIFKNNPDVNISPSRILRHVNNFYRLNWPITSCRRSITNLCNGGVLIKTENMVEGMYGKPEHTWKYKTSL